MKIGIFGITEINPGKHNLKDSRLDEVDKIVKAKKKTYVQIEAVGEDKILEADAILSSGNSRADLILKDLELVETRATRAETDVEKGLLEKLKQSLEREELISGVSLSEEEKKEVSKYTLYTARPVIVAKDADMEDLNALLMRTYQEAGYISFFTAGEKETRAWSIKKGATAWEAAGVIHSDIQRGFIRAEIISFDDYIQAGGESFAKQAGKQRLEQKEYQMKDADLANFRFNK